MFDLNAKAQRHFRPMPTNGVCPPAQRSQVGIFRAATLLGSQHKGLIARTAA